MLKTIFLFTYLVAPFASVALGIIALFERLRELVPASATHLLGPIAMNVVAGDEVILQAFLATITSFAVVDGAFAWYGHISRYRSEALPTSRTRLRAFCSMTPVCPVRSLTEPGAIGKCAVATLTGSNKVCIGPSLDMTAEITPFGTGRSFTNFRVFECDPVLHCAAVATVYSLARRRSASYR